MLLCVQQVLDIIAAYVLQDVPTHHSPAALHLGQIEHVLQLPAAALAGPAHLVWHEWHPAEITGSQAVCSIHEVRFALSKQCLCKTEELKCWKLASQQHALSVVYDSM